MRWTNRPTFQQVDAVRLATGSAAKPDDSGSAAAAGATLGVVPREALPVHAGADARAARRCSRRSRSRCSTTAAPTSAPSTSAASSGCRRSAARRPTCCCSRPRGPARWSRPSANLCAPGDARASSSPPGAFGERWERDRGATAPTSSRSATSGARRRAPTTSRARLTELGGADVVFLDPVGDLDRRRRRRRRRSPRWRRRPGALVVVDAVSSLGAVPLETDAWGLDVVVSGSQKALMTPPGLALARSRTRRWSRGEAVRAALLLRLGADAARRRRSSTRRSRRPSSLVVALDVALGLLLEEGSRPRSTATSRLGRACRARREGDGPRAVLARRGPLRRRHRDPRPRGRRRPASSCSACATGSASRSRRPGRPEGQGLPHRPHRLLRHLRHHDRARRGRARPRRARRRRSSAASRSPRALEAFEQHCPSR